MSVLIKGMEMPRTCSDCEWSYYVGNGRAMCRRVSKTDKTDIMTKRRADFCPLSEVPTPHGRLIDGDALKAQYVHGKGNDEIESAWISNIRRAITKATTVIEAED